MSQQTLNSEQWTTNSSNDVTSRNKSNCYCEAKVIEFMLDLTEFKRGFSLFRPRECRLFSIISPYIVKVPAPMLQLALVQNIQVGIPLQHVSTIEKIVLWC